MKILIINQHTNNFGDDAAGYALVSELVSRGHKVAISYIWNKAGTKIPFEHENVIHFDKLSISRNTLMKEAVLFILGKDGYLKKLKKLAQEYDSVLVSPGGANIGIYKDWAYLANVIVARMANKNVIFHLNTIGESNSRLFNFISLNVLKKCILFVREKRSFDFLRSKKINVSLGVDTAFLLPPHEKAPDSGKKIITFIPTQLSNWHVDFRGKNEGNILKEEILPSLSEFAAKNNYIIRILPHLYASEAESGFLEMIKDSIQLYGGDAHIDSDVNTFFKYDEKVANSELVVSMRYHGVVLAVKNKTKVISLAYENKMKECCRYSNLLSQNIDLLNYDNKKFIALLDNSLNISLSHIDNEFLKRMALKPIDFIELYNRESL
ncbi:polysaccharide pyruvyl transferase family protein [Escherichia albertii]|uniref:polysaccharide pyruvyl transferase family protein n=1 Tax=Escherichia albertii TaxID=208962 RepID=UPI00169ECB89|nr:polysaccharide pyruvyl transferase family protein [Escherichia albertii]MCQ8909757.1 polysaccharide pyruvyl transferase family protein [Escherichia albertii]MCQ8958669.1 polysaccharide pyruvyl transferase family protein [Escherichia albertii]MCQ8990299.1 polysaccharide pyruvyl transferase family protein [Escherichia albertii]UUL29302.1 polysaccharide pyruvyl transferase family protein [Escherichia albertii]UUL47556.1 polysaccharide pyruvyl transferase family protein [Escherichia albertii]